MDRIVSQLLAELDALHLSPHKVFVMAATNRADLLDPSLRTPGRFDKVVNVRVGNDVESRRRILEALSRKTRFSKDVRLQEIAALCSSKMSGADLYSVISNATMIMLRETIQKIEIEKVEERDAEVLVTNRHLKEAVAYVNEQKEAVTGAVRAADLIE
ncbi:unnamed protein product, partial [Mesorhabditis belari]|uniref:Peroxisomal ATPase PEX1 n=1 Tax=Mesorhabditis belari TaxID=2138241 RepID=A0AAF3F1G0_9BILA